MSRVVVDANLGIDKAPEILFTFFETVIDELMIEKWSMRGVNNIHKTLRISE